MAKKDWMILLSDLDDDQLKVFNATNDKSCVVSGCAGSGKSVLALIKAQRIQKEKGDNYKVIVYTKALRNYMNAGKNALGLNNDIYYLWTYERCNTPSADYIIVDEIQDFTQDEIKTFIAATNKNFFFFGDTAQSIYKQYKSTIAVEEIHGILPSELRPKTFELYRNYRLPIPVARVVQHIGIDLDGYDEGTYKNLDPTIPRFLIYDSLDNQINAIVKIIKDNSLQNVGILLPDNSDVFDAHTRLNNIGLNHEVKYSKNGSWKDDLNFATDNPKVMTYHSAKGLQFETIFLPKISNTSIVGDDRRALYVAMTRTYKSLYVMYSGNLPNPLSDVPQELIKTSEIDLIEDI